MHTKLSTYFQHNNVTKAGHHIISQFNISKLSKLKLNKEPLQCNNTGRNVLPTWAENRRVVRSKYGDKSTML